MKNKKFETILYSTIGVVVMAAILVAVNVISGAFKTRADLTADKVNTLTPGTRAILRDLDSPVEIRFYWSKSEVRKPAAFENYAKHVEDILREFQQAAKGKIEIKKYDPEPDSDAEDLANLDGIEPRMVASGDAIYLGLAVSMEPQKVALPFLSPDRERLLEYDIARAIARVMSTNKPVVGVMTPLPVFGQPMNQMMMRMGQQPQQPWIFITELQRDFEVRQVPMGAEAIDDDIKVLLVMHPKDISEAAQYAIDQFVLRGGRLLAFLDAMSLVDSNNSNPMMGMLPGGGSSLDKLLKAWGVEFLNDKVVADRTFTRQLRGRDGRPQVLPAFLFVNEKGINNEDAVMSQLDNLLFPFSGAFSGTPAAGLNKTVLAHTTTDSQLVDGMQAQFSGQKIIDDFKPSDTAYSLAMRLSGKFKTAFPDGKPSEAAHDHDEEEKKQDEAEAEKKADTGLKEATTESVVVLIGDTDFIYDNFCVEVDPFFRLARPVNGNLAFAQGLVEQLAGDERLIGVRSRASLSRPFTVVRELEAQAEREFQAQIQKLEAELAETQNRLNELQAQKEAGQQFILSPEQQAELVRFKQKETDAKQKLKEVRKNLRKEIDSLENRLKWLNIAGMPLLVTIAGIALAVVRKQRTKAQ